MPADRSVLESVAEGLVPDGSTIEHLGTGGFACTFKVSHGESVYALKVIDPHRADGKRVERELSALQRVDHPGVVRFHGFGVHPRDGVDYRWIKMDFVDGYTLKSSLAAGQVLAPDEAIELLQKLVQAAAAIWDEGTAHRDLSPGNIMLKHDGDPVIVDLGMAKHVDDETLTALPTPGTPGWMSPEQVSATPTHGDWRSDQFVLGAIGYLLLTRVVPFYAPNIMEHWASPAFHTPRSVTAIDPDIPNAVADVIERMLRKQPHRRYLKVAELLSDLEVAAKSLENLSQAPESLPRFYVNIGHTKNWAENGFLSDLEAAGTVIDLQAGDRVAEFAAASRSASSLVITDPSTWFARSPIAARPAGYKRRGYGGDPILTGFSDEAARVAWCQKIWDAQWGAEPDVVLAPYFYAGEGELAWIRESLACARVFSDFAADAVGGPAVWTTVQIHANWLANEAARDQLLTGLTGQTMDTLHLLVHTGQPSFGPLPHASVLNGFRDLFDVMRDAGVPVVVGKRASSGILLLALGASGWTTGVAGNLMNAAPHPEEVSRGGGPAADRIYVPKLLNLITLDTYILMRQQRPNLVELDTAESAELLAQNPELDSLTTEQRVLLLRHNLMAQKAEVEGLVALPAGARISLVRDRVEEAMNTYRALPPTRVPSEGPGFLDAWEEALS